jgi:hypothetical protein
MPVERPDLVQLKVAPADEFKTDRRDPFIARFKPLGERLRELVTMWLYDLDQVTNYFVGIRPRPAQPQPPAATR